MDHWTLAHCEQEQLHRSGQIIPDGTLLMLDQSGLLSHLAANLGEFLEFTPEQLLDQPLPEGLGFLLEGLAETPGSRQIWDAAVPGRAGVLDALVSRGAGGSIIIELVPNRAGPSPQPADRPQVPTVAATDLLLARQHLVDQVAQLSGLERVMYYRFHDNGDGEVTAEARRGDLFGSYLGLRFPATDIPRVARDLYLKNPWRMIGDARADPVPLVGRDPAPADLTWSDLRSVSPVHRAYLANMGVRASLSLPLVSAGTLIALVAAHHSQPHRPPLKTLEKLAELAHHHALEVIRCQSARRMTMLDRLSRQFGGLRDLVRSRGGVAQAWPELGAWLLQEFQVDGALLCWDQQWYRAGLVLESAALDRFDAWFCAGQDEVLWLGDNLARQVPHFPPSAIAGALALRGRLGDRQGPRLYLCRAEHLYQVAWGGNPNKPVEYRNGQLDIAPRRSFDQWVEQRRDHSRPWDSEIRLLALKLRDFLYQLPSQ